MKFILVVFLSLAALYESWGLPASVIMVIPLGVVGALAAVTLRGFNNDVYFQVKLLTQGMRQVLNLYKTIYVDEGLGDPVLQQEASGRDTSFQEFAAGRIAILFEGDYFWRSVINPAEGVGTAPMAERDTAVGYAKIPAVKPGAGINGQDFVSMSGSAVDRKSVV